MWVKLPRRLWLLFEFRRWFCCCCCLLIIHCCSNCMLGDVLGHCFILQYFVCKLSRWGRENWLLYFCCVLNVISLLSEFHFLLVCLRYNDIRREFLPRTAWPSVAKFISIMSSSSQIFLLKLSKSIGPQTP